MSAKDPIKSIQLLLKNKEYSKVIDACDIERMKGKSFPSLYYMQGVAYFSLDNLNKAEDCFLKTLTMDETHQNSFRYLVEIYMKQENWKCCIVYLNKLVEMTKATSSDDCVKYLRKLMKVYEAMNNNEKVVEVLLQIIELSESNEKVLSIARKKLIGFLSSISINTYKDLVLIYDIFTEMKSSNSPSFTTIQTKCYFMSIMDKMFLEYSTTHNDRIKELISQFLELCNSEEYLGFVTEVRLSHSFMNYFYIPVEDRRHLADEAYSDQLEMKRFPYLSIYSSRFIRSLVKEKGSFAEYSRGLLLSKSCEEMCVLRELFFQSLLNGDSQKCEMYMRSLDKIDYSNHTMEKDSLKEERFAMKLLLSSREGMNELILEMQQSDCFSKDTQLLLEPLLLSYQKQYQCVVEYCEKQDHFPHDLLFLAILGLVHSKQFDQAERLLRENHVVEDDAIYLFYTGMKNVQNCSQESAYSNVVVPLDKCLVSVSTESVLSVLTHRLFFEEVCLQLGNLYHDRMSNGEEAIKYYRKILSVNQTSLTALKAIIPCCYERYNYSLMISICESMVTPSMPSDVSLYITYHIAQGYSLTGDFNRAVSEYQKVIEIAKSIQSKYSSEKDIDESCGKDVLEMCSWFAICRYYKCECECYLELLKINSALKVIQCCIDCLKEHYNITIEPIANNPDTLHSFLFNCLILQAEILFKLSSFNDALLLLQSISPAEDMTSVTSGYYHLELVQYHLAKCYYAIGLEKYNQGSVELSHDHLYQAYHLVSSAEKTLTNSRSILELKANTLRQLLTIQTDLNLHDTENIAKQLKKVDQKRILFDPSNVANWTQYIHDSVSIETASHIRFDVTQQKEENSTPVLTTNQRKLLSLTRSLIQNISSDHSVENRVVNVNSLSTLWICLSLLDPRCQVKEMALLECISLQNKYREFLSMDVGIPFCHYAVLLIKEGKIDHAKKVIEIGRSLSSSNMILLFIDSYCHYLAGEYELSIDLAETCCLLSTLPESSTLFLLLLNSISSETSNSLIIQCSNLLLRTENPKLHLLSAKALLRLHQYQKVMVICDEIGEKVTDEVILNTAQQLHHIASKLLVKEVEPSQICQQQVHQSLFKQDGFVYRLLNGAVSSEDLKVSSTEKTLFESIWNNPSLTPLQKSVRILHLQPYNVVYQYLFYITHATAILHNQAISVPLTTLLQFGSSLITSLHNTCDKYSSSFVATPSFRESYQSMLILTYHLHTLLSIQQGTSSSSYFAAKSVIINPTDIFSWEIFTIHKLYSYLTSTDPEETSNKSLNSLRRLLSFIVNETSAGTLNGLIFRLYNNLFSLKETGSLVESAVKSNEDLSKNKSLLHVVKRAYVFDQEIIGYAEKGNVKNVQTVLKTLQAMSKMEGVDSDSAFLLSAESALVFYRNKQYDYCLKYLKNMTKTIKEEHWKWTFIHYAELLCYTEMKDQKNIDAVIKTIRENSFEKAALFSMIEENGLGQVDSGEQKEDI